MQHDFPKMGAGSNAVWNFSENSYVLVTASVPYFFYPFSLQKYTLFSIQRFQIDWQRWAKLKMLVHQNLFILALN